MATDLKQMQNHHIVPDYWCKELGLTTSYKVDGKEFYFKENLVRTTRKQHSLIHWGYYCGDLSLLLEVCSPEQWVLDMIPLGDNRDVGAAQYIALGEVDGIDSSGENNPNYKHGRTVGGAYDPINGLEYRNNPENKSAQKAYQKEYRNRPEYKEERKVYDKKYRDKPGYKSAQKAYQKEYYNKNKEGILVRQQEYRDKPGYKEKHRVYVKAWNEKNKEKIKAYQKAYQKEYYARKKLERATATLDNFM